MAAKTNPSATGLLTFEQKRALLAKLPATAREPLGVRDLAVGILGGTYSAVRRFTDDVVTEYKFSEAARKGQL